MHYIAWRISEGAVPYRDLFDMNFPGVYLLHLAALKLFGAGDVGWRAFDLVWLAGTSLAAAASQVRSKARHPASPAPNSASTAMCIRYTPGKFMSKRSRYGTAPSPIRQAM